jgi:alanine dehydrogenase
VRGVEGIPQGNLDQYVFPADDPKWDRFVPDSIPSKNRRTTVTCYSWPGVHPEACMMHYAQQLGPFMEVLFEKGYDGLSLEGSYFERALYRATLKEWVQEMELSTLNYESPSGTD